MEWAPFLAAFFFIWAIIATALWVLATADGELTVEVGPPITEYERQAHKDVNKLRAEIAQLKTDKTELAEAIAYRDREAGQLRAKCTSLHSRLRRIHGLSNEAELVEVG